ncbi:hypothetical protein [Corynebacterium sp. A21]|uniref:hypothetical protein n=1 Tax=Corynebacterium sp. A21 TaxID=3457318 RepID=UPI003FD2AFCB
MINVRTVVALVLGAGFLSGCTSDSDGEIARAVQERASFSLAEVVEGPVTAAYVFCQYTNAADGVARGFEESDFFGIHRDPIAWEAYTGIGLIFEDGTASRVEWFAPKDINACPASADPLRQLDPDQTITVNEVPVRFVRSTEDVMVNMLSYS